MKNSRFHNVTPPIFCCIALSFFSATAHAAELNLGKLPYEKCVDTSLQDDLAEENQRFWFSRVPPYVGYSKGERTTAGGDGTCYVGFPRAKRKSALVVIDDSIVEVFPTAGSQKKMSRYSSNDRNTIVEIHITGGDTTCEPNADKCCGDYTYATITVKKNGKTKSVKAANYSGS
jgi:hypothetical protein